MPAGRNGSTQDKVEQPLGCQPLAPCGGNKGRRSRGNKDIVPGREKGGGQSAVLEDHVEKHQ